MAGGAGLIMGFQRALFSNEAGLGSASIAHSAVRPALPRRKALWDARAFYRYCCGPNAQLIGHTDHGPAQWADGWGAMGIEVTSAAFVPHSMVALSHSLRRRLICVFNRTCLVVLRTSAWNYLVGVGKWRTLGFQLVFLTFFALGCVLELKAVLDFSDAMIFLIALPNLVALYLFAPMVKAK